MEERVQARLQRQLILDRDDAPFLLALIDVGVLRRPVGGPELMRNQLNFLLDVAQRPAVSIQLVDPACLPGLMGAFMIAELPNGPTTIHADSITEAHVTSDPATVAAVSTRYDAIRLWAYPEHVSLRMIKEVTQEWT